MKRLIGLILSAALALTVLAGCVLPKQNEQEGLRLWFLMDLTDWTLSAAAMASCDYQGTETVPAVMAAMLAGPTADSDLISPIPQGTVLQGWSLNNGILHIDLSRPYGDLVGVDLTLADYCLTLTLAQLEGVEGVYITVNGADIPYRDRRILYADDVLFSGAEEDPAGESS